MKNYRRYVRDDLNKTLAKIDEEERFIRYTFNRLTKQLEEIKKLFEEESQDEERFTDRRTFGTGIKFKMFMNECRMLADNIHKYDELIDIDLDYDQQFENDLD